jgi:aerobic carbon-monoxide dehydrogenase small subunit
VLVALKTSLVALQIKVNGEAIERSIEPTLRLIDLLRDELGLKGTNSACDTAQCGACTVLVDGMAIKSCNVLAVQVRAREVLTIEGLSPPGDALHVMQQAFSRHHGLQCGYCTPGFVMRSVAMVSEGIVAEPDAVKHALSGNICRCTGYEGIVSAVCEGLQLMRASAGESLSSRLALPSSSSSSSSSFSP